MKVLFGLIAFIVALAPLAASATERFASPTGIGSGSCPEATPCHVQRGMDQSTCSNNDIITLLDGVYQGTNYMITPIAGQSGTDATHQCTVRAKNDGGVFIDGQFLRRPVYLSANNYWTFQGFDVGNAGPPNTNNFITPTNQPSVVEMDYQADNHHLTFKRICASNTAYPQWNNTHVWAINSTHDSLFEDICGFGLGRNTLVEYNTSTGANTYRRVWLRWEGYWMPDASLGSGCGGGTVQTGYHTQGTSLFENMIVIWDGQQMTGSSWGIYCYSGPGNEPSGSFGQQGSVRVLNNRDEPGDNTPGRGDRWRGLITFGRTPMSHLAEFQAVNFSWIHNKSSDVAFDTYIDAFIDARSQPVPPIASSCGGVCEDRVTALRDANPHTSAGGGVIYQFDNPNASQHNSGTFTNFYECTTLETCPSVYEGTPGTGSRACFRYVDGTLTGTKLWPWPMDGRIKAALNRAFLAGTGGSPLMGSTGSGYDSQTVTSEMVFRYGAIPAACFTSGGDAPVVTITGPTSAATYVTRFTPLSILLALAIGLSVFYHTWSTVWNLHKEDKHGRSVESDRETAERR